MKNWYLSTLFRSFLESQCILPLRLRRRDSLGQRTSLLVEDIIHLLSFSLKTTQLAYNSTYHQQVSGTAMGSPVSDVITNIVMEDVEQRALATSPVKPFFWKRYVDDVISAVSGNEAERLLSIQFTLEREKDRHLPFLDLNVSRGVQGNLETSVYRKPTHTDKYLAFDSHHPICHKKLKLLKNLFRLWGIFSSNLRILSRKNNEPTPFILFLAMTVTTNTSDRPNVSLVHV